MRPLSELLPIIESHVYNEIDSAKMRGDITAQPGHLDPLGALRGELRTVFDAVHEIADSGHDASRDPALVLDLQTKIDGLFKTHQERGDFAAPPAGAAADPVRSLQARIDSIVTADLPPPVDPAGAQAGQPFAHQLSAIEHTITQQFLRFDDSAIVHREGHPDPLQAMLGEFHGAFQAATARGDTSGATGVDPMLQLHKQIDGIIKSHQESGDLQAVIGKQDAVQGFLTSIDAVLTANEKPHMDPAAAQAAKQFASTLDDIEKGVVHEIMRFEDMGVFYKPGQPDALLAMKGEFQRAFEAAHARGDTSGANGADAVLQLQNEIDGIIRHHQENGDLPTAALGKHDFVHDFRTRIDGFLTPHEKPQIEAAQAAKQFSSALNDIEQRLASEIVMADSEGVFRIQPGHADPFLAIKQEFQHAFETAHARGDTSAATGVDPVAQLHKEIDGIIKSHQANGDLPAASAGLHNFQERVDAVLTSHEKPHVDPVPAQAAQNAQNAQNFNSGLNDVEARLTTEITKAAELADVHVQPGQTDPFLAFKGDFHSAFEAAHARGDTSAATGVDPMLQLHKEIDGIIKNHQLNGHLPVAALGEHDFVHDFRTTVDAILTAQEKPHVAPAVDAAKQFASTLSDIEQRVGTEIVRADIDGIFHAQPGHPDPYLVLKGEFQHAFETAHARGEMIRITGIDPAAAGGDPVVLLHKELDGIIKSHRANGDLPAAAPGEHDFVNDFQKSIDTILTAHEKGAGPAPAGGHALIGPDIHAVLGGAPAMLFADGDMLHGAADAVPHGLANFFLPADQGAPHELGFMLAAALDGKPLPDAAGIHPEYLPMESGATAGTPLDATTAHDIGHALDHAENVPAAADAQHDLAHDHLPAPLHTP